MKKNLFLIAIMVMQCISAQILSKDNTFALNGVYTIPSSLPGSSSNASGYWSRMVQNQDGGVYFTYIRNNTVTGDNETVMSKTNSAGNIDTTFGFNGQAMVTSLSPNSHLQKQIDGKLLIIAFHNGVGADTKTYADVFRFLPNGQLDLAFGNNGVTTIANVSSNMDGKNYGLFLQNNKIIFYGEALDDVTFLQHRIIYRLNENGSIDTTFGNNGSIDTQGKFVFLDSQSNFISFNPFSNLPSNNAIIEKYNADGQTVSVFGNNGVLTLTFSITAMGIAYMDSNDRIIYSTMDGEIARIDSNGTLDSTFVFNSTLIPFPIWIFSIVEKNGLYYIGGMNQTNNKYFISRLTQSGTVDSIFNYFLETDQNLQDVGDMIINDNNIIANGGGYIVKYLSNNSTLSTEEKIKTNSDITFENPINQNLVYKTKEKVSKIELYSLGGKLVNILKENKSNVSALPKGVYMAKVTLENGKEIIKKLIKK